MLPRLLASQEYVGNNFMAGHRGGVMYLRAVDWKFGMKDKIDLQGPKLKEKQGLYTCPPSKPGDSHFHCCLEVKEELIKASLAILACQSMFCRPYCSC